MANIPVYVSLPDGQLFQFDMANKSLGQDCLDKICRVLCIVGETDYFGLQYRGHKGEFLWVNLKNKLIRQLAGSPPYQLLFRVKFFVPPHQLLQEETKYQFFINVRWQVIRGTWYDTISKDLMARFIALLAQQQYGDYSPMLPYSKYSCLWTNSEDSFMLADCYSRKGSTSSSLSSSSSRNPVPPQQNPAEDVFMEEISEATHADCLPTEFENEESKLEFFRSIAQFHQELIDLEPATAAYRFIKLAATGLPYYGTVFYQVKDCFDAPRLLGVAPDGVIVSTGDKKMLNKYSYTSVQKITESNNVFFLMINHSDNSTPSSREYGFQLVSRRAASALYRHVTETHCFFCCDTVRQDVADQVSRGVKGVITSLLSDHSDSMKGKEFVFDIRYTFRELYDAAKRQLYTSSASVQHLCPRRSSDTYSIASYRTPRNSIDFTSQRSHLKPLADPGTTRTLTQSASRVRNDSVNSNESGGSATSLTEELEQLKFELARREDCILCQVCMEKQMSRVFVPCGHVVCCAECSLKMDLCPLCRVQIAKRCPISLPWNAPLTFDKSHS